MRTDRAQTTVVVASATGRLGALVDVLLARGHTVRAISRNPGSAAPDRLRGLGAEVVYGDFDDPASITAAATGARAIRPRQPSSSRTSQGSPR